MTEENFFDTSNIENQLKALSAGLQNLPNILRVKIQNRQNEINSHVKEKKEMLETLKNKAVKTGDEADITAFGRYKREFKSFMEGVNNENEVIDEASKIVPEIDKAIADQDHAAIMGLQTKVMNIIKDLKQ